MKNILILLLLIIFYSCIEKKNNEKYNVISYKKYNIDTNSYKEIVNDSTVYFPYINEFDIVNKDDIEFDNEYQYDCGHMSFYEDIYDTTYSMKRVCKKNCKKN